jgi:gamma-glutamyltranspeptidase/glutathione hydrolase
VWATVGARGGRRITGTVAQVISNLVDHDLGPQAAVSGLISDSSEPPLRVEAGVPVDVRSELERRGHRLAIAPGRAGAGADAILVDAAAGTLRAGEDHSGVSAAGGY